MVKQKQDMIQKEESIQWKINIQRLTGFLNLICYCQSRVSSAEAEHVYVCTKSALGWSNNNHVVSNSTSLHASLENRGRY